MGYWEGKCFNCIIIATLIAIITLSVRAEVKERKRVKQVEKIQTQYQDSI